MKRIVLSAILLLLLCSASACSKDTGIITTKADAVGREITLVFEKGGNYTHPLEANRFMTVETTPQIAVWIEDDAGAYIDTLFVTKKGGTQGWLGPIGLPADSIRRPEALPYWSHRRGVIYPDGYYLPTKDQPLTDAITAASPAGDFHLISKTPKDLNKFIILAEVNNSTDFNDAYPKNASPGFPNYSGGQMGSGQPSVVYAAHVDLTSGVLTYRLSPIGHGSPDGSSGELAPDLSSLTTATDIIKSIAVTVK